MSSISTWHISELADIELALKDLVTQELSEDAEVIERARLRAERRRLQVLPAVPDQWLPVESCRTYADEWGNWPRPPGAGG